jgi:hypothetical protein
VTSHAGRIGRGLAPLALAVGLGAAFAPQSTSRLDVSTKALTARAAAYVADYQTTLAFLIGKEQYSQTVWRAGRMQHRAMTGDLYLVFMPTDREWIAVHDVAEVDGQPVPDRDNLQTLLHLGEVTRVAQQVANRNASFNIGSVGRNFNEPTLALLVLEAKRIKQFRFDRRDLSEQNGVQLATLAFTEHDPPTLVRETSGKAIYSKGEIVIETETGRIRRTVITFRDDPFDASLTTDYVPDDRLGLWVPGSFSERYNLSTRTEQETTTCEAAYSDYHRFEVTGRIKN